METNLELEKKDKEDLELEKKKKREEWMARYRKWLTKMAENNDSVYILPFGGRRGAAFVFGLSHLDRAINNLKRNSVFVVPIEEVKRILEEYSKIRDEIWELTKKYIPRLYDFDPNKWRMINDSIQEKRMLALRRNVHCILPRCEETGSIAVAMKLLHKASIEYQQGDIETYERMIMEYIKMHEKIKELEKESVKTIEKYAKVGR